MNNVDTLIANGIVILLSREDYDKLLAKLDIAVDELRVWKQSSITSELERYELQEKLDIAVEFLNILRHWDMLWSGEGQPHLVADGAFWKRQIDETLKKLE